MRSVCDAKLLSASVPCCRQTERSQTLHQTLGVCATVLVPAVVFFLRFPPHGLGMMSLFRTYRRDRRSPVACSYRCCIVPTTRSPRALLVLANPLFVQYPLLRNDKRTLVDRVDKTRSGCGGIALGEDITRRGDAQPHHDYRTRHRGEKQGGVQEGDVSLRSDVCSDCRGQLGESGKREKRERDGGGIAPPHTPQTDPTPKCSLCTFLGRNKRMPVLVLKRHAMVDHETTEAKNEGVRVP